MTSLRDLPSEVGDLFSTGWTRAMRSLVQVAELPEPGAPLFGFLTAVARQLEDSALLSDAVIDSPDWPTSDLLELLTTRCRESLKDEGIVLNKKKNAPVPDDVNTLLGDLGLVDYASSLIDMELVPEFNTTFVVYDNPGSGLELHVDLPRFGDVNFLLCLERTKPVSASDRSETIIVKPDRIDRHFVEPGDCVIFDGVASPHGRTPLQDGESVILLLAGFKLTTKQDRKSYAAQQLR